MTDHADPTAPGAKELAAAGFFHPAVAEQLAADAVETFDLGSIAYEVDPMPDPFAGLEPGDTIELIDADGNHVATGTVQPRKPNEALRFTIPGPTPEGIIA